MQRVALIGYGAVAEYVMRASTAAGFEVAAVISREGRQNSARARMGEVPIVTRSADLPTGLDLVVDCAGHQGLHAHGVAVLRAGLPLITVSVGALAEEGFMRALRTAAEQGQSALYLASGAIGGLDALSSASIGALKEVAYVGRKPPEGWRGSPAETVLDLDTLTTATVHFDGTARACALAYPKNANVAASVALAGLGFDKTRAQLIADPTITQNIHEVTATGDFGSFTFTIQGNGLPTNPKSSALTAMSVVNAITRRRARISLV